MKKIFSFFAAVLFAGSMMAQAFDHGLYVPANASLEVATEVGTTANLDKTTGDLTINVAGPHTTWGTWGNQIKLTTGITNLDPTKSYEIGFTAVASTDDCPVAHEKAFDDTNFFDIESDKYTTTPFEFKKIVSGTGATNGIMVWSFTWTPAQTVTISNIYVRESVVTYSSLADVRKCAKGDKVTLKAFEVTYAPAADTRYYYIKDATSTCVIYANNYGLKAGDKVDMGLEGEVDIYNGLYEIKPITAKADLKITSGAAPQPAIATAAPLKILINFYPQNTINEKAPEIAKTFGLRTEYASRLIKEKFYDKGVGGEIILKTKEAGTIHIWYSEGHYSNNQQVKVWIEGLGEVDFDELVYYLG